jgi:hypothetical protein
MKTLFSLPVRRSSELGAFNPALPLDGSLVVANVLRDQFNGLAAMIDAISAVNAAVVDGVQTLPPGDPASVSLTLAGDTLHFSFGIPRGDAGSQGEQGNPGPPFAQAVVDGVSTLAPGSDATVAISYFGGDVHFHFGIPRGDAGQQGAPGPPFAQAVVDGVTTLPPGWDATVAVSFDGTQVHFSFGIPRGDVGPRGEQGIQGPPGEVTLAQLNSAIGSAISGTSSNSNGVATLGLVVSDPPTQAEMQQVVNKLDELITALRR